MCNFFSLVVTEDRIYHDIGIHSHLDLISKFNLEKYDLRQDLVKIEVLPSNFNTMEFNEIWVDQDKIPEWFNREVYNIEIQEILSKVLKQYGIEKMQLAAVEQNGCSIQDISNPSERVQLTAVKQDEYSIRYISNPGERIQLTAVKRDGNSIRFINNPSERVQLTAVNQNGNCIQYINNPGEKIQLAAVRENKYSIRHVKRVQLIANCQLLKNGAES